MSTTSKTVYKQDGTTTYCYYSTHTYDSPLSNVAKADIQSATSGTPCPVQLTVTVPPTSVDKNSLIALKMTAVISDKDKPASFEFPGAGSIPSAAVPSYIGTSSANNTNSTAAASGTKKFQVPVANFFICDYRNCDAFSDTSVLQGNKYASTNNPQNFDGTTATFESNELMAAKDGKYTGIAHIGMYLTPESRLDFVTYFPVQIGDVPGAVDTIKADATSTYCWVTKKHTPFETSLEESYMSIHTNTLCPGTMSAVLSKTSVVVGEEFTVDFGLQLETTRDPATIIGEVSPTDAVFNPSTNLWSVVPVAVFGACLQNSDDKTKTCSTYAGTKSRTRDVASFYDRNLTAGAVKYSTKTSFNEPGKYLLISRVAMQTLDGDRIDMAVYSNINVAIPATKSGGMFLYIGLGIGLLILVIGFAFCFMRKRRARRQMKEIPFRTPMPPASVVQDRSSQYTATSSNFVTHRSPQMKIAYPQYDNNSFYPAQGNDGYGDYRDKHKDSFSLDPYRRNSFNEIGDGESIDMTIRPSDASKFSFQTGYDDQQDWEYDTQSYRSEKTDYSDVQRGTFHLNTNGGGQLPIMEEDDRDHHRGGNHHNRHFEPQSVGRSTTSSEWTVRG